MSHCLRVSPPPSLSRSHWSLHRRQRRSQRPHELFNMTVSSTRPAGGINPSAPCIYCFWCRHGGWCYAALSQHQEDLFLPEKVVDSGEREKGESEACPCGPQRGDCRFGLIFFANYWPENKWKKRSENQEIRCDNDATTSPIVSFVWKVHCGVKAKSWKHLASLQFNGSFGISRDTRLHLHSRLWNTLRFYPSRALSSSPLQSGDTVLRVPLL